MHLHSVMLDTRFSSQDVFRRSRRGYSYGGFGVMCGYRRSKAFWEDGDTIKRARKHYCPHYPKISERLHSIHSTHSFCLSEMRFHWQRNKHQFLRPFKMDNKGKQTDGEYSMATSTHSVAYRTQLPMCSNPKQKDDCRVQLGGDQRILNDTTRRLHLADQAGKS